MFGDSVEAFLDLVIDHWDELYPVPEFGRLCDALYDLYHDETQQVMPEKTNQVFKHCMLGLMKLHKNTGGRVLEDQHGYHEFHTKFSTAQNLKQDEEPYRVYVNASTRNVIVLGRILVKLACIDGQAVYFKIASDAKGVDRRKDSIVIYTFGKNQAEAIAKQLGQITGDQLTPSVPGMTREVAKGISVAADPKWNSKDQVSFGQHRVRPFATAIVCYRDQFALFGQLDDIDSATYTEVFRILLAGAFRAHNINALDPSSNAPAVTKSLSKSDDVLASKVTVPSIDIKAAQRFLNSARKGARQ
jgi:hypothetical protein